MMGTFKIFVNKFKEINFDRLNLLANYIAKENNKSVSYVKFDMIRNFLKYKIGYTDYFKSDYINLTKEKKKDFVTSKNFINVIGYLNPRPYRVVMNDKLVFNQIYSKYLGRDYLDIRRSDVSDIKAFLKGKKNVFLNLRLLLEDKIFLKLLLVKLMILNLLELMQLRMVNIYLKKR